MSFVWRILLGAAISALGFLIVWKSDAVRGMVGMESDWVNFNLGIWGGMGGVIKMVGVVMIFAGFFIMTGLYRDVLESIVGVVVPVSR